MDSNISCLGPGALAHSRPFWMHLDRFLKKDHRYNHFDLFFTQQSTRGNSGLCKHFKWSFYSGAPSRAILASKDDVEVMRGHRSVRFTLISAELYALLLFHFSSVPPPPLLFTHTTLSALSGCPPASLPGATGVLGVTRHRSALDSTVSALLCCACVCVCVFEKQSQTAQLCMHVQNLCPSVHENAKCCVCVCNAWIMCVCVCVSLWVSVLLIRAD